MAWSKFHAEGQQFWSERVNVRVFQRYEIGRAHVW
jgi:hypothetical protein